MKSCFSSFQTEGLILLSVCGSLHYTWILWRLIIYYYEDKVIPLPLLMAWFMGAIGGIMLGAYLNAVCSKIRLYVSTFQRSNFMKYLTFNK